MKFSVILNRFGMLLIVKRTCHNENGRGTPRPYRFKTPRIL